ncbi:MAG: S1 RNA-binding domain-containing protein [Myxococcota bacterium]
MTEPSEPRHEGQPDAAPEAESSRPEHIRSGADVQPNAAGEERPMQPDPVGESQPAPAEASSAGQGPEEAHATEAPSPNGPPAEPSAAGEPSADASASSAPVDSETASEPSAEAASGGEPSADASASSAPAEAGAPAEAKKKKRRRKKRKKKAEGESDDRAVSVPFGRFFDAAEGRRHAFSVGEVVAGRVERVARGVIVVDLFGKAKAIADEHEPHEIPPMPEPEPEAASAEPGDAASVAGDVEPSEGNPEARMVSEGGPIASPDEAPPAEAVKPAPPEGAEAGAPEPPEASEPVAEAAPEARAPEASEAAPEPDAPLPEPPPVRSIFRGRVGAVAESGHVAILNRIVDREAAKARIAQAREAKQRVRGIVFGYNRGGFDVLVEGLRAFCPASGMSLEPIEDPEAHVAQKLEFTLPPNKGGSGIIVSRRGILEREARKRARERLKSIEPGHRMVGHVTAVRDYGVFVDLGEGLEGMVHVSELSWQRDVRPGDLVRPGDEVVVRVLEVKPASRKERIGRVALSIRAVEPDPWDDHGDVLQPGTPRRGRVVRTTDFGAFVELVPGIDGLLHISELGKELKHASQAIKEGEEIDVVVDRVDRKQRRISLSKLTAMEADLVEKGELDLSKRPRSLKPGSHITVLVDRVEHGGVVVKVQGVLGRRGRGFIPNRELQSPQGGLDRKQLQAGAPLDVKIIGTDRDGGLRCSVRARHLDEERKAVQEYRKEVSKQGLGTFGDLLRAKLQQDGSGGGG